MDSETQGFVPHIHQQHPGTVPSGHCPPHCLVTNLPSAAQHPHTSTLAGSAPTFISNPPSP